MDPKIASNPVENAFNKMKTAKGYLVMVGIFLAGVGQIHATNYSWNVTSGTWSNSANWSPNGVPGSGDNILTPSSTSTASLPAGTTSVNNFTYSPSTNVQWTIRPVYQATATFSIGGTLTVDDGGSSGLYSEHLIFENYNAPLTVSITGALNVYNANLSLGGDFAAIHSVTVNGLTTIGGSGTPGTAASIWVQLDAATGATANFAGGVAFGTGATTSLPETFVINAASSTSQSVSAAFLSGGNNYSFVAGSNSGSAAVTSTLVLNGNTGTNGDTGSNSFAGIIEDNAGSTNNSLALQKTGTDTQILTGANTYSGGTTVTGGALLVSNSSGSSGAGTGSVSVTGGLLGGSGIIAPGSGKTISVGSTAALASGVIGTAGSGSAVGTGLTINAANASPSAGFLTLTGATLDFNLGAGNTASTLNLTGTGSVANEITGLSGDTFNFTDLTLGSTLSTGLYTLIATDSTNSALFGGLSPGNLNGFTLNGLGAYSEQLQLNKVGSVYDVQLDITSAPEPGTLGLMGLGSGVAGVIFLFRRRCAAL